MGYSQVYFCGRKGDVETPERQDAETPTSELPGREMPRHWRMGHWRPQAHGPRWSLRKSIWIKPVLVRADREPDPERGRVYFVNPPSRD